MQGIVRIARDCKGLKGVLRDFEGWRERFQEILWVLRDIKIF